MIDKDSVILHASQLRPIKEMSDAQQLEMFKGIMAYVFHETYEFHDPVCQFAFKFVVEQFTHDKIKWDKKCEMNRQNSLKAVQKRSMNSNTSHRSVPNSTDRYQSVPNGSELDRSIPTVTERYPTSPNGTLYDNDMIKNRERRKEEEKTKETPSAQCASVAHCAPDGAPCGVASSSAGSMEEADPLQPAASPMTPEETLVALEGVLYPVSEAIDEHPVSLRDFEKPKSEPKPLPAASSMEPTPEEEPVAAFVPPTVEEVAAYAEMKGYGQNVFDPYRFVDHYTNRNWCSKGSKTPMKDWKRAVTTWMRRRNERPVQECFDGYPADFQKVIDAFPRKTKLKEAFDEYDRQIEDGRLTLKTEELVKRIRYRALEDDWKREDGRFVPLLVNWLREAGYNEPGCFERNPRVNVQSEEERIEEEIRRKYHNGGHIPGNVLEEDEENKRAMNKELFDVLGIVTMEERPVPIAQSILDREAPLRARKQAEKAARARLEGKAAPAEQPVMASATLLEMPTSGVGSKPLPCDPARNDEPGVIDF